MLVPNKTVTDNKLIYIHGRLVSPWSLKDHVVIHIVCKIWGQSLNVLFLLVYKCRNSFASLYILPENTNTKLPTEDLLWTGNKRIPYHLILQAYFNPCASDYLSWIFILRLDKICLTLNFSASVHRETKRYRKSLLPFCVACTLKPPKGLNIWIFALKLTLNVPVER